MAKDRKPFTKGKQSTKEPAVDYYQLMISRYHSYLDSRTSTQKRTALVIWSVIALVLLAASVIPIPEEFRVLSALVGTPAGVIIWFILAGLFRETKLSESWLANLKASFSPARRARGVYIGVALFVIIIIFTSSWIPYGIGGIVAVILAMFCFYFLAKTDEEKKLDEYGLPDPRDYAEFYEELEDDEEIDFDDIDKQNSDS